MYLWHGQEYLMMPEYLKIPPLSGEFTKNIFTENPG